MKIQTKALQGEALNFYVGKILERDDGKITCVRKHPIRGLMVEREVAYDSAPDFEWFCPTRIKKQARQIIDREKISTVLRPDGCWSACTHENYVGNAAEATGPTPEIAALRCYVTSRFGSEIEVIEIPEVYLLHFNAPDVFLPTPDVELKIERQRGPRG